MTQSYTLTNKAPTIFKIGEWGINSVDRGKYANIEIDSIIIHNCESVHSTDDNWQVQPLVIIQEYQLRDACTYCQETCPPEIQALWRLQNMEKL